MLGVVFYAAASAWTAGYVYHLLGYQKGGRYDS